MLATRLEELLEFYNQQVKNVKDIEQTLKDAKAELHKLQFETMPDVLAEYGSNEIKVGEHWFRMKSFVVPKINEERYDEALDWIQLSGYGAIKTNCIIPLDSPEEMDDLEKELGGTGGWTRIYERKIHHKTLEAAVKKMLQNDLCIPPELISVLEGSYVKID